MLKKSVWLVFLCAVPLFAQDAPPANSTPPSQTQPMRRGHMEPCWQVAGIDRSVVEQRQSLERETHSQVEAVCSNSSLTPQQKRQQVREIRQQAHQKLEGLLTADQEKALTACQQQRGMNHPGGMGGGLAGCGEMPRGGSPTNTPQQTNQSPQN